MFSSLEQAPLAHVSPDMSPTLLAPNLAWWVGTAGTQFWRGFWDSYALSPHSWLGLSFSAPLPELQEPRCHVL